MTAVAENYLIFLVALWRPLIESVVAEYDVVFFAVVLYADDLLDDIALCAVHVGCVFDKIRDAFFHDFFSSLRNVLLQKQQQFLVEHLDIHGRVIEFRGSAFLRIAFYIQHHV